MSNRMPGTKAIHIRRRFILILIVAGLNCLLRVGLQNATATKLDSPLTPSGTIHYVKTVPTGSGDGNSWVNATSLQGALANAIPDDEIWVAAGTYLPGTSRTDSFNLVPSVAIYGGFAGNELMWDERDWIANLTILSGDIGTPIDNSDNSYHVVQAIAIEDIPITSTTILDGFIITAGNANGTVRNRFGGGFYCYGDDDYCNPSLSNLIFSGNNAIYGGAMYNYHQSNPILTNVSFSGNSAASGGAIYTNGRIYGSDPTLTNVAFIGNSASGAGGAIYTTTDKTSKSNATLTNVIFFGNSATRGGAMYNYAHNGGETKPTLTNVTFFGNSATNGGGIYNSADDYSNSRPNLTNVIMWGDIATEGEAEIFNSDESGVFTIIDHSLIQGMNSTTNGNLDGTLAENDPHFVDALNGDLRLQPNSPVSDVGDNGECPTTDLRGVARPQNTICDMGAYEFWGVGITAVSSENAELSC